MVTMADVARRAGVSVTTVSHVLNRTRPVRAETQRAVRAALEQTGYVGDGIARSLRTGTTHTLGLAMSAILNPYFAEVVRAVEREAAASGYSLLLADTHDDPGTETRAVADILARRVDAMVLAPSAHPAAALRSIRRRGLPVVLIDRFTDEAVDQVGVENEQATATLVEHLAELGHRRIAMVTGLAGLSTTAERLQGYRLGLERAGLAEDPELIAAGDSHEDGAAAAVSRLFAVHEPPTALVTGNNQMTIGALRALQRQGVRVPSDIALVAYDDFPWADLFSPRLTAMAQPTEQIGRTAVALLLARLGGDEGPPRRARLDPVFQHRTSCGCPGPGGDQGRARSPRHL